MKKYFAFAMAAFTLVLAGCLKDYDNPAKGVLNDKAELYVVRQAFQGSALTLSENHIGGARFTAGTVISDNAGGNINSRSFVIQNTAVSGSQAGDLTTGIVVELTANTNVPALGDSVLIDVMGARLERKQGRLVLTGLSPEKVKVVATNRTVVPRPVTLSMLTSNFYLYESTLVSVHADVSQPGTAFAGEKQISDNTGTAVLYTAENASFASATLPANAQFTGIALYKNDAGHDTAGAKKAIVLRNSSDVNFVSGPLYAGFPESFETPDAAVKSSYNMSNNDVNLSTGSWRLLQAILANTILSDKINLPGKQAIRMQQNLSSSGYVQMNFDVTEGLSKVTVFYGRYSTDPRSSFRLEYSTNGGTSWTAVNPVISDMPERGSRQAVWMLNLSGNVRLRINKLGLGASSATVQNGRLSLDDFAIYKK